ncbi:hypothetical protein MLD38_011174 [Melastoma candidum]|uniref:Uncharacterized protein n=1 Tax=Melastoma candidum TaxID=119954 RepID=A0ACB9R3Z0_9MYRT|nr:hypothetical protein MLD38_011174 [Melastoma candidum]
MACAVCMAKTGEDTLTMWRGVGGGGNCGYGCNRSSVESEHDLAVLVTEFLENGGGGGSYGAEPSLCSSDSDSGFCDLPYLASKISVVLPTWVLSLGKGVGEFRSPRLRNRLDQFEISLQSLAHSYLLSISETDLLSYNLGPCSGSCLRFCLVKLLRRSGYDAAVCSSRWAGDDKVPGGDHEFVDVLKHSSLGASERLVIEMDFRSHFEIARAVDSYERILSLLPVVYVGSLSRLSQYLQVMAEAARFSLKQNAMPLPPWRSLAYLQAKWLSPYQRQFDVGKDDSSFVDHKQCSWHLTSFQSSLALEVGIERLMKPVTNTTKNRKIKLGWRKPSFLTNSSDL